MASKRLRAFVKGMRPYVDRMPWLAATYRNMRESLPSRFGQADMTALGFRFAGHHLMRTGEFEPHETRFLDEELPRSDVFVDIGANIGYFTCLARSRDVHTIAVEPLEQNLRVAYRNIRANEWTDRLEVFPVALSDGPGLLDLYGVSTGASLIRGWAGSSSRIVRTVPVSTLDTLLAGRFSDARLLIKIDVEGAELQVLRGAHQTLKRNPQPRWLVEVCFDENQDGINPDFSAVFELFWTNGYRAETVEERRPVRQTDVREWIKTGRRSFGSYNFLFLPERS